MHGITAAFIDGFIKGVLIGIAIGTAIILMVAM
jgi:hypothetical protein